MKTTIDIDEKKLLRVMKLTGLKKRKDAVDFALTEAERLARVRRVFEAPFYVDPSSDVIDPKYDLAKLREKEKPAK